MVSRAVLEKMTKSLEWNAIPGKKIKVAPALVEDAASAQLDCEQEEPLPGLPQEILHKIVEEHLPLISLCRVRRVCKAWTAPRLGRAALNCPLYLWRKDMEDDLWLYDREVNKMYNVAQRKFTPETRLFTGASINGLVGFSKMEPEGLVISVLDMFLNRLNRLPPRPEPKGFKRKDIMFEGISKKPDEAGCRLGMGLDSYYIVVAIATPRWKDNKFWNFKLQVFSDGQWSTSKIKTFPAGYTFAEYPVSCTVLHGSMLYFLATKIGNGGSVKLCCFDVLGEDKQCKIVPSSCDEDIIQVLDMFGSRRVALGICVGKVTLAHELKDLKAKGRTVKILMLDKQELKLVSCSLLIKGVISGTICCGGDEVLSLDGRDAELSLSYRFSRNEWEKVSQKSEHGYLQPICYM